MILAAMLTFISCTQEDEFETNANAPGGFQVSADFIDLTVGKDSKEAGTLTVNSDEREVNVKWISEPSFNIDTTQTTIAIKGGKGVLPIKWQRKLENGSFAPEDVLFKAGVVLVSGEEEKYIPLYNVQKLDSVKVRERLKTRAAGVADAKAPYIQFLPTTVNMGENGASLMVRLNNIEQSIVDYSNIKSIHNIDLNEENLPTLLSVRQSVLMFKWKNADVRPAAFEVPVLLYAFELDNELSIPVKWVPETPEMSVDPVSFTVAAVGGNVFSNITSNTTWTATKGTEEWLSIDKTSGNGNGVITFTVATNTGAERSAKVKITAGSIVREITITQAALEASLEVAPTSLSVTNEGGIVSSTVSSNTAWTVAKGNEEWFSISPESGNGNGTIEFTVAANNDAENTRTANVTVTAGSITKQIVVIQEAGEVDCILIGGVKWAKGNVNYDGNNFYIEPSPYSPGAYFKWGALTPQGNDNYQYDYEKDPCSKVAPAGTWITPSVDDLEVLVNPQQREWDSVHKGCLVNGSLFLPANGIRDISGTIKGVGEYIQLWSRTKANSKNPYLLDNAHEGTNHLRIAVDWMLSGRGIRCVKK